ncbi:signal peptidase [Fervidicella metallireducens AeB]|uniref:Signal peptidase I n=1 Tax=Fervidicella metallireducens AeB TaxID=1403537 RepID=A0A017RWE7_9CLOT|nr:signal peptidase I [Fervidicella metallireducens]EYE88926.1 signal peptidase [Fervidicella metallireducens AeB]
MNNQLAKEIKEWIICIIVAGAIAFLIKGYVFDIIQVSGTSMVPTLHDSDRVAVEKISLYNDNLKHGEIIIFDPGSKGRGIYIKRIIGLPGDEVEISDGCVYVNGKKLVEDYLKPGTFTEGDQKLKVPNDSIFVLGDNREVSEDSRYIGPIPIKNIKGHAILRVFPFNQIRKF